VCEVILAEELERNVHYPNGRDLPAELDEAFSRVHGIAGDRTIEAGWLSRQLIWVAGVLIDLGLPSI
jgi:hypothetical protein